MEESPPLRNPVISPDESPLVGDTSTSKSAHEVLLQNPHVGRHKWKWDPKRFQAVSSMLGIEIIDMETGQAVAIQKSLDTLSNSFEELAKVSVEVQLSDGRKILVDPRIPVANLEERLLSRHKFSPVLCSLMCELVAKGKTVHDISEMQGMPSVSTIRHWRRAHEEFDEMWRAAQQDYAEFQAREALRVAKEVNDTGNPDLVGGAKLLVDTLKWSSEKADPEKYGAKVKHTGEVKHSVSLVVDTGIRRLGDAGFVEVVATKVEEKEIEEEDHGLLPDIQDKPKEEIREYKEPVDPSPVSHTENILEEGEF